MTDTIAPVDPLAVTVTNDQFFQGVTVWLGDGYPVTFTDEARFPDVLDWIDKPLQRAVVVARLRAIADMFDTAEAAS